jgi:putative transposase
MSKSAHTEAQIIGAVKQVEAGRKADEVAREMGVSKHTIYAWKQKYGGLEVAEAQELKQLRDENGRLKRLVADLSLDKDALQYVIRKNGDRPGRRGMVRSGNLQTRKGQAHI